MHALSLLRLAELCGRSELAARAQDTILALGGLVNRYPSAFGQLLAAVDFLAAGPREVVIAGELEWPSTQEMLARVRGTFQPARVVALAGGDADETLLPLVEGRGAGEAAKPGNGQAVAHVCRNYACRMPTESVDELEKELTDG